MFFSRTLPRLNAAPISAQEFSLALKPFWDLVGGKGFDRCGIAVSGGADSLALAALCRQPLEPYTPQVLRAFVVDHAARPGSSEEADHVVHILQSQLGYQAQKLRLHWDEDSPARLSNFETVARIKRHQALGRACRENGVQMLLFGQHQGDEYETMLSRLVEWGVLPSRYSCRPEGVVNMPECEGMYDVHESDVSCPFTTSSLSKLPTPAEAFDRLHMQRGGLAKMSPLVSFDKQRLIATCQAFGVQWVEDPSNADPTVTMRNAIRSMYQNHKLPEALGARYMAHVSRLFREDAQLIREETSRLFDAAQIRLDTRTGSLKVLLPSLSDPELQPFVDGIDDSTYLVTACFIRALMRLVYDDSKLRLTKLRLAVASMYPNMFDTVRDITPQMSFNLGGVLFRSDRLDTTGWLWYLSRESPPSKAVPKMTIQLNQLGKAPPEPVLFDRRFWIRVSCDDAPPDSLCLRRMDGQDLARWHRRQTAMNNRDLEGPSNIYQAVKKIVRSTPMQTLPVLAIREDFVPLENKTGPTEQEPEYKIPRGEGVLRPGDAIALPTLGLHDNRSFMGQWAWLRGLTYEASYRKVDLGSHKEGVVVLDLGDGKTIQDPLVQSIDGTQWSPGNPRKLPPPRDPFDILSFKDMRGNPGDLRVPFAFLFADDDEDYEGNARELHGPRPEADNKEDTLAWNPAVIVNEDERDVMELYGTTELHGPGLEVKDVDIAWRPESTVEWFHYDEDNEEDIFSWPSADTAEKDRGNADADNQEADADSQEADSVWQPGDTIEDDVRDTLEVYGTAEIYRPPRRVAQARKG